MKRLLLALAVTSLLLAPASYAAKGDRKKGNTATTELLKKYDTNANGKIDGAELEAVRKDFAGSPDLNLKALDKDNDGKLSDTEIEALKGDAPKKVRKKKTKSEPLLHPAPGGPAPRGAAFLRRPRRVCLPRRLRSTQFKRPLRAPLSVDLHGSHASDGPAAFEPPNVGGWKVARSCAPITRRRNDRLPAPPFSLPIRGR